MLHFVEIQKANWSEWTHIVLSLKQGYYSGSDWLFGERRCTSPPPITDDRWEKHERSGSSWWNESRKLITIPCNPIFRKNVHATNLSYVTSDHLAYNLPHYASEVLVGRRCLLARRRTGSKEGPEQQDGHGFSRQLHPVGLNFAWGKKAFSQRKCW